LCALGERLGGGVPWVSGLDLASGGTGALRGGAGGEGWWTRIQCKRNQNKRKRMQQKRKRM
jgi:hypothetical protein